MAFSDESVGCPGSPLEGKTQSPVVACPAIGGTRWTKGLLILFVGGPIIIAGACFLAWAEPGELQELKFDRIAPGEMPCGARIRFLRH